MMKDLMIDLETLGTDVDAPVLSIGAVFFDIEKKKLGTKFYMPLSLDEQFAKGRMPSASTLSWWARQTEQAKRVFTEEKVPVQRALYELKALYDTHDTPAIVWGNGSSFDISILEHLYKQFGIEQPWTYRNIADLRTFKRFVCPKVQMAATSHNALEDAIIQANYVMENVK